MKVVLFCGGPGMRMRDTAHPDMPKPMQMVGPRPLIWHVMRYYAYFGHTEFILCLGYGASHIKDFFLGYRETVSNNFVIRGGQIELTTQSDVSNWSIRFVDTGQESAIGERLRRVRGHLAGAECFLANYADVLTDAPLDDLIEEFHASGAAASMMLVPPQPSFNCAEVSETGQVRNVFPVSDLSIWENGGYFVLTQQIFDVLPAGADLVSDGCKALAQQGRLYGYRHRGFWKPADTFRDRAELDASYNNGARPWMLWEDRGVKEPVEATG